MTDVIMIYLAIAFSVAFWAIHYLWSRHGRLYITAITASLIFGLIWPIHTLLILVTLALRSQKA